MLFLLAIDCGGASERSRERGDDSGGSSAGATAPGTGGMGGRSSGSGGTIPSPETGGAGGGGIDPYLCGGAEVPTESIASGSCDFATPPRFPGEPFDPDQRNVLLVTITREGEDPTFLYRVEGSDACSDALSWYYAAAGPETIVLCPAACDVVLTTDVGLGVVYACDGDPPPRP